MRLALAQLNPLIGDLEGNAARILAAAERAAGAGAALLLTPELSLWGYPPRDLLLRPAWLERQRQVLEGFSAALPEGLQVLIGLVDPVPGGAAPALWNALALAWRGGWRVVAHKRLLPSYDVFDESRYFRPGDRPALLVLPRRSRGPAAAAGATAAAPMAGPEAAPGGDRSDGPGDGGAGGPAPEEGAGLTAGPDGEHPWRLGLSICEDLWVEQDLQTLRVAGGDPIGELAALRPDLLLNLSASPYGRGKLALRRQLARRAVRRAGCPLLYVNQVGGNDELVFDGASFVVDGQGRVLWQGPGCREALALWDADSPAEPCLELPLEGGSGRAVPEPAVTAAGAAAGQAAVARGFAEAPLPTAGTDALRQPMQRSLASPADEEPSGGVAAELEAAPHEMEQLLRALVLGVADYARKCGFPGALLGLSGGIDSALVAVIAAAAFGAERVSALRLPSPWSSQGSLEDAQELADRLGLRLRTVPIQGLMEGFDAALTPVLGHPPSGVTAENLQSRIRGTLLMALANQQGSLLLSTGNKSELAVGYCTLYGDMNGGLAVIGDLYKTTVFDLCDWIDSTAAAACRRQLGLPAEGPLIGEAIRRKPPSAELRPDQRDSDSLPDYAVLDPLLRRIIESMGTPEQLIAEGTDPALAQRVQGLLRRAEFKRRQAPPVLKVSSRSFGGGWRMPIATVG